MATKRVVEIPSRETHGRFGGNGTTNRGRRKEAGDTVVLPDPPAHLTPSQVEHWFAFAEQLASVGTLATTDTAALALLAESYDRLRRLNDQLQEEGETYRTTGRHGEQYKAHPAVRLRDNAQRQVVELLQQMGLTPYARKRQKIEEPKPTKENPFAKFG